MSKLKSVKVTAIVVGMLVLTGSIWFVFTFVNDNTQDGGSISPASMEPSRDLVKFHDTQLDDSHELVSKLRQITEITTNFEQSILLDRFLQDLDVVEINKLLQHPTRFGSPQETLNTWKELFKNLSSRDPSLALNLTEQYPPFYQKQFVDLIFREWSSTNLDDSIAHLASLDAELLETALFAILDRHKEMSTKLDSKILYNSDVNDDLLESKIAKFRTEQNPRKRWNELVNSRSRLRSLNTHSMMTNIALELIDLEGINVVQELDSSFQDRSTRLQVLRQIFHHTVLKDPLGTFDQAVRLLDETTRPLMFEVVETVMRRVENPTEILQQLSEFDDQELREDLLQTAYIAYAQHHPTTVLELISESNFDLFSREFTHVVLGVIAQQQPKQILEVLDAIPKEFRTQAMHAALHELANLEPVVAATFIDLVENTENSGVIVEKIINTWLGREDFATAVKWIVKSSYANANRHTIIALLHDDVLNYQSPFNYRRVRKLFDSILEHPINADEIGLEWYVMKRIIEEDMNLARKLLPQVRTGVTRLLAEVEIAYHQLLESSSLQSLFDLGTELDESDQSADFFGMLFTKWVAQDPGSVIQSIKNLSSDETKSRVATWLVKYSEYTATSPFDEVTLDTLRSYIPERTLDSLEEVKLPVQFADLMKTYD